MKKTRIIHYIFLLFCPLFFSACSIEMTPPSLPGVFNTLEEQGNEEEELVKSLGLLDMLEKQNELIKVNSWKDLSNYWVYQKETDRSMYPNIIKNDYVLPTKRLDIEDVSLINSSKISQNKNDFKYLIQGEDIYFNQDRSIHILKAYPASDANFSAKIDLDFKVLDFYLKDKYLYVISESDLPDKINKFALSVYDISDLKNIHSKKQLKLEGTYMGVRFYGEKFYLISKTDDFSYDMASHSLPEVMGDDCDKKNECKIPDVYAINSVFSGNTLLSVNYFDLSKDGGEDGGSSVFILPKKSVVSASKNNIYLTYPKYLGKDLISDDIQEELLYDNLDSDDRSLINKIRKINEKILNDDEKRKKIRKVYETYLSNISEEEQKDFYKNFDELYVQRVETISKSLEKTVIHKISLQSIRPKILASSEIDGYIPASNFLLERGMNTAVASIVENDFNLYTESEKRQALKLYYLDEELAPLSTLDVPEIDHIPSMISFFDNSFYIQDQDTRNVHIADYSDSTKIEYKGIIRLADEGNYYIPLETKKMISLESSENGNVIKIIQNDINDPRDIIISGEQEIRAGSIITPIFDSFDSFLYSREKNVLILPISLRSPDLKIFGNQDFKGFVVVDLGLDKPKIKGLLGTSEEDGDNNQDNIKKIVLSNDYIYIFSDNDLRIASYRGLNTLKIMEYPK